MHSRLCEAVARCHLRRLAAMAAAAPLPASIAVLAVLLAPPALLRVGRALGTELSGAIAAPAVAEAVVLGPALAAAVGGAALAAALPERAALGRQIAAAPFGMIESVVAVLLVPALAGAAVALPSLLGLGGALGHELPGGPASGIALSLAVVAAFPAGAVVAEAGVAASRGIVRRSLSILALAVGWALAGLFLGSPPLGPLATVPSALRGDLPPSVALVASCATALGLAAAWVALAASRPRPRVVRTRRARPLVRGRGLAITAAVAALLGRRRDLRISVAGSLAFGAAGVALVVVTAAPAPAAFLLGTTTALFGSVLCSLVACGVLLDGRWLWKGSPCERRRITVAATLVTLTATAAPVAVVGLGARVVSGASARSAGIVAALVVTGCALALIAGSLVPWRSSGVGDQLTTFASFAAIALTASLLVGLAAPRLVSLGVPDTVVVVLVCATVTGLAGHALGRRLGGVRR